MVNSTNLVVVIAVIAAGLIVLAALGFLLQRRRQPQNRAEVDFDTAWSAWFGNGAAWSDRERAAVERLKQRGDPEVDELRRTVAATADRVLAAPEPAVALRRAIMDATDEVVMAETLGGPDGALDSSNGIVSVGTLRSFAKLRFNDHAPNDWYGHYVQVAEMNSKNVGAMVRKTVGGDAAAMETALHDPLATTMRQVRQKLLRHPARTPVTRADTLTDPDVKQRLNPSQKQVDLLTATMRQRFDKLFSGQVYNLPKAPPVNPVGAFHIDAGILYAMLDSYFRHPRDAWRKIMGEALGPYKAAAMQNEELLLEHATSFARVWSETPDGALTASLQSSWQWAFETEPDGTGPVVAASADDIVNGMVDHAGPLVSEIRNVIEKH